MTIIRTVRAVDIDAASDDRSVTVTCSTEMLGRDDLIVRSEGIDLTWYQRNPVWLWQHDPDQPIARAENIGVTNGKLVAKVRFPPEGVSAKSDEILGLIRAGVVNAASIGFDPKDTAPVDPKDPRSGVQILRCELNEVSFVSVPALPDALVTERAVEEMRRMARRADADWKCGAAKDLPIDDSGEWDGQAAADSIFAWAGGDDFDPAKAKQGFLLYNAANDKERGSYKLPFARAVGGELKAVKEGLRAAASRLPDTDAPQSELDVAKAALDAYEKKADIGDEANDKDRAADLVHQRSRGFHSRVASLYARELSR